MVVSRYNGYAARRAPIGLGTKPMEGRACVVEEPGCVARWRRGSRDSELKSLIARRVKGRRLEPLRVATPVLARLQTPTVAI